MKSLYVSVEDTARDCIRSALRALDLLRPPPTPEAASEAPKGPADYQLWVRTKVTRKKLVFEARQWL